MGRRGVRCVALCIALLGLSQAVPPQEVPGVGAAASETVAAPQQNSTGLVQSSVNAPKIPNKALQQRLLLWQGLSTFLWASVHYAVNIMTSKNAVQQGRFREEEEAWAVTYRVFKAEALQSLSDELAERAIQVPKPERHKLERQVNWLRRQAHSRRMERLAVWEGEVASPDPKTLKANIAGQIAAAQHKLDAETDSASAEARFFQAKLSWLMRRAEAAAFSPTYREVVPEPKAESLDTLRDLTLHELALVSSEASVQLLCQRGDQREHLCAVMREQRLPQYAHYLNLRLLEVNWLLQDNLADRQQGMTQVNFGRVKRERERVEAFIQTHRKATCEIKFGGQCDAGHMANAVTVEESQTDAQDDPKADPRVAYFDRMVHKRQFLNFLLNEDKDPGESDADARDETQSAVAPTPLPIYDQGNTQGFVKGFAKASGPGFILWYNGLILVARACLMLDGSWKWTVLAVTLLFASAMWFGNYHSAMQEAKSSEYFGMVTGYLILPTVAFTLSAAVAFGTTVEDLDKMTLALLM